MKSAHSPQSPRSAPSIWPLALLLLAVLVVAAGLMLSQSLPPLGALPFSVVVDGQDIAPQIGQRLGLVEPDGLAGLFAAAMALVLLVGLAVFLPLLLIGVLALVLLVLVGAVLAAVGAPLLALAAVAALLLSPLILLVLLLRWLIR